jgi:CHAT domain-containing protein/tetratricopeptide (TPR) repeat protein
MRLLAAFLPLYLLVFGEIIYGQCPGKEIIQSTLGRLKDSEPGNLNKVLNDMLDIENSLSKCKDPEDSLVLSLYSGITIAYYHLADYLHAIQYANKALDFSRAQSLHHLSKPVPLNKYFYFLSVFYDSLQLIKQRNDAMDSCISYEIKQNGPYVYSLFLLADRAKELFSTGEYALCADQSTLGEAFIHKFYRFNDSLDFVAYFVYYRSRALFALKNYSEAANLLRTKEKAFEKLKNKIYLGGIYSLYGYLYKEMNEKEQAVRYFEKAIQAEIHTTDKSVIAQAMNEIGIIYSQNSMQIDAALVKFNGALKYANEQDSIFTNGNIGRAYLDLGLFDSAQTYFQRAFDNIEPGMNENKLNTRSQELINNTNAEYLIKLVLDKAENYRLRFASQHNQRDLDKAVAVYKSADKLLNRIKADQHELASKLFWRNYARKLYERGIEAAYLQNNLEDIFYFFEKGRSVLLSDQLSQLNQLGDEDILKLSQVKKKLLTMDNERRSISNTSLHYLEIQKEMILLNQQLNKLELQIREKHPLYYQNFLDTSFITLIKLRSNLNAGNKTLFEIYEGDSAVFTLLIAYDTVRVARLNKNKFDSAVKLFNSVISNASRLNANAQEFYQISHSLYKMLFPGKMIQTNRLIISPGGQYFPVEALAVNDDPGKPDYFMLSHTISYTFSAGYLLTTFNLSSNAGDHEFLGFAPIQYSPIQQLPDLPGSDKSLQKISSYFYSKKNLFAENASRSNFMGMFAHYRIVQLYTHAAGESANNEPVIHFPDSSLYLSALIPEYRPETRLVVLSACETGKGKLYNGEGVFSFNRGFASLGIPSTVSTLWSVDNQSTYKLTELFYKYVAAGEQLDVALQKAKLEFIKTATGEKRLPYYWAGMILAGKTDAIPFHKQFPWKDIVAITGVSIALYIGRKIYYKRRGRKSLTPTPGTAGIAA